MAPTIQATFRNGLGKATDAVIDFDGVPLLATDRGTHVRLTIWPPAHDVSPENNPGWGKLRELHEEGLVAHVIKGRGEQPEDYYEWLGEPFDVFGSHRHGAKGV